MIFFFYLPTKIFVVGVSHIQRLGGEGVGLYLHIGPSDLVDEAGFTNIRKA